MFFIHFCNFFRNYSSFFHNLFSLLLRIDLFLFLVTCHGCSPPLPSQIDRTGPSPHWDTECRTSSDEQIHRRFVFILSTERDILCLSLRVANESYVLDFWAFLSSAAVHPRCNPLGQLRQKLHLQKSFCLAKVRFRKTSPQTK